MSTQDNGKSIILHRCDQVGCSYETNHKGSLNRHKAFIHDIGVIMHRCYQSGCSYKTKQKSDLNKHKAFIHDIGVIMHRCDQSGCSYETKQKSDLNRHKADIHDIGVIMHRCSHCDYKAKQKGSLNRHREYVHDIGTNECQFCYKTVIQLINICVKKQEQLVVFVINAIIPLQVNILEKKKIGLIILINIWE